MELEDEPNTVPPDADRIRVLGRRIQQKRVKERLTLERAAEQSGISAATLSRLERQSGMKTSKRFITPDTRTIAALSRWLGESLDAMIEGAPSTVPSIPSRAVEGEVVDGSGTNLPETVEVYLRADRNLSPEAAEMLAEMFRLAYQQYSRLSETQHSSKPLPPPDDPESGT